MLCGRQALVRITLIASPIDHETQRKVTSEAPRQIGTDFSSRGSGDERRTIANVPITRVRAPVGVVLLRQPPNAVVIFVVPVPAADSHLVIQGPGVVVPHSL